jgi:F-type H+-transporting ATPase subunit gamma
VANLRDIKRRITSVKSTQKITSAMKMVSAVKLRRAQEAIENARPYAERMRSTLEEVSGGSLDETHPLLEVREEKKKLELVVVSSDRGLAGAFNSSVAKCADAVLDERSEEFESVGLTLVGKKVTEYYQRRRKKQISDSRPVGANVTYTEAAEVGRELARRFEAGDIDEVVLVYSEFKSIMRQQPTAVKLLPVTKPEAAESEPQESNADGEDETSSYEIEPSAEELLAALVPKAVEVEIFRAMLENQAGEHAARMTAMESATKNTEELIEKLTLQYNRARQAAITGELVEIVTGAQALE